MVTFNQAYKTARYLELELIPLAILKATITIFILGLPYENLAYLAFPLITGFIYIQDRLTPDDEDHINDPDGPQLLQQNHTLINATSIIMVIAYELLLIYMSYQFATTNQPTEAITTLIIGNYPIIAYLPYSHLKNYLFIDTLAVSTSWALTSVFLPQIFTGQLYINTTVITLFTFFLIGETALVELYNAPDIKGDNAVNKTTIPVLIGADNMQYLFTLLAIVSIATLTTLTTNPLIITLALIWLTSEYIFIYPKLPPLNA